MNIWNVLKKNSFLSNYFELKKQNKILMDGMTRPSSNYGYFAGSYHLYPAFPYNRFNLYDFSYNSDVLTAVHNALRRELFRNGIELAKAKDVKEESTSEGETIPKGKTTEEILEFLETVNENQQSIIDVCMEIEDDFSIMDNAFMVFMYEYTFDDGKLKSRELKEILRADPRIMGPILNRYNRPAHDDEDLPLYFCPQHRDQILEGKDKCPKCGNDCWLAYYFKDFQARKIYYSRWEVVFRSKYRPTLRGGFPPTISVWQKTRALFFMDKYIMELYDGKRPPKHGLFFKTNNQAALEKAIGEAHQKIKDDPHWPWIMAVPDSSNGKEFVQFIDFMRSLEDLQHTEMRNEFRRQIGSIYGIEPIFQGDQSNSGGLNNEGLQITVTNRAVEYGQGIYNNYFFKEVIKAIGAKGFSLTLNPSEEQDEMAKLQRQQMSLFNGQLALQLGLEAKYDDDVGEVIITPGELEQQETQDSPLGSTNLRPSRPTGMPPVASSMIELAKAKNRLPFSKLSNTLKKEIENILGKFKKKPSEAELSRALGKVNLKLKRELVKTTDELFKKTYINEMGRVEKEMGINVLFDTIDENTISVLSSQDVLSKAYDGIASNLTNQLNGIIHDAYRDPKGLTVNQITDKIKDLTDISDSRAETIARTETAKVSSAARKNSYSKEESFDTFLFKWIGPNDSRTTDTSKRIKDRTKAGVSWEELVKIIEQESSRDFPEWSVDKNYPVSHYNSRHTFVKIPGSVNKRYEEKERKEMQDQEDILFDQKKKETEERLNLAMKRKEVDLMKDKEKLFKKLNE